MWGDIGRQKERREAESVRGLATVPALPRLPANAAGFFQRLQVALDLAYAEAADVGDALFVKVGLIGEAEEVDDDAGGIKSKALLDRIVDDAAEQALGKRAAVHVRHIGAHDERRLFRAGDRLENGGRPRRKLNRVGSGLDDSFDRFADVLDAPQEGAFVKESVVDGDVETLAVGGEESVESGGCGHCLETYPTRRIGHLRSRGFEVADLLTESLKRFGVSRSRCAFGGTQGRKRHLES